MSTYGVKGLTLYQTVMAFKSLEKEVLLKKKKIKFTVSSILLFANAFNLDLSTMLLFCIKMMVKENILLKICLGSIFSFNDLMLKTNQLKKDFFYKDRLIFGLDDPVVNMSIWHVYYA